MPEQSRLTRLWHQLSSPPYVARFAQRIAPWCYALSFIFLGTGLFWGLFIAPSDYQQQDAFRMIYVHVPVAALSMGIYVSMAVAAVVFFVWHIKIAAYYCRTMVVLGSAFTALALITGAIWGKPMWGTFWSWGDPRLLSELILLFLYLGYWALVSALKGSDIADKAASILLMVGVVNIPIIHYSVVWWNSLHQGATVFKIAKPSIDSAMLWPLLASLLGFVLFTAGYALIGVRTRIIEANNERRLLASLLD